MEDQHKKSNPFKIIVFILIGGALIILTDLFILDGKNHILYGQGASSSDDISISVSILKEQHNLYMDDGIDIEPEMLAKIMPAPPMDDALNAKSDDVQPFEVSSLTIEDLLTMENDADLANIEPALGTSDDLHSSFARNDGNNFTNRVDNTNMGNKDVTDVLYDLGVTDDDKLNVKFEKTTDNEIISDDVELQYVEPRGKGMVVIIIDDMGVTLRSKQVEVLSGPLTLSYLPYAKNLEERTKRAKNNGHELMLHMPMEPINGNLDGGPKVLQTSQSDKDFIDIFNWGLSSFDGFVGVNNHMGSRLTKDSRSMRLVMDHLKGKNLFFIDSKTIGSTLAASTARSTGIPYAERDVFLDHEINIDFIRNALKKLEHIANDRGYAVAIGHPHKETIAALKEWLPTLKEKGLILVPASKVVKYPSIANNNVLAER